MISGGGAARGGSTSPCRDVGVRASPPASNTGAEITLHWLRGSFCSSETDILELVNEVTGGGYCESLNYGGFFYRKQHVFLGGLRVFVEPAIANMPPVLIDCPGSACEALGFENLQLLFCNAELSRVDVAFDHAPFTPREAAGWVRGGNVRTRAKAKHFVEDLGKGDGETLYIGSRGSEQFFRCYDARGFTRVELELKGKAAKAFQRVLLADSRDFVEESVGVLRSFVDFVDRSSSSNISRCGLLPSWEVFTQGLERVQLRVAAVVVDHIERVTDYLENQVSAMLYTYHRAGRSVGHLLKVGKERMGRRHRVLLATAGVLSP